VKASIQLVALFAPPPKLVLSALASSLATWLMWLAGFQANLVPIFACLVAWTVSNSWDLLLVQPIGLWDRAWPVLDKTLIRTRLAAPCVAGWVPNLASLVATAALCTLGVVEARQLGTALLDGALLFALTALLSLASHQFARRAELALSVTAGLIAVLFSVGFIRVSQGPALGWLSVESAVLLECGLGSGAALAVYLFMRAERWWAERAWRVDSGPLALGRGSLTPSGGPRWKAWVIFRAFYADFGAIWLVVILFLLLFWRTPTLTTWVALSAWLGWVSPKLGLFSAGPFQAHLPISRRRVFILSLVPFLVFVVLGSLFENRALSYPRAVTPGWYMKDILAAGPRGANLDEQRLLVPSFLWRATLDEPPMITAPNGQSRRLAGFQVVRGLPLTLYNPFDARVRDEPGFVAYQLSRALREGAWISVSPAEVQSVCSFYGPGLTPRQNAVLESSFPFACLNQQYAMDARLPPGFSIIRIWLSGALAWLGMLHALNARRRREKWYQVAVYAYSLALWLGLNVGGFLAFQALHGSDPTGSWPPLFTGAVLIGELTRWLQGAPLSVGCALALSFGLMLWDAYRRFQRMEPFSGRLPARSAS
jgi:hypothetical protein